MKKNISRQKANKIEELHKYFLSISSHDLKSPLTSIIGFARIMKNKPDIDGMIRDRCLNSIIRESERMVRIINNMLIWEHIKKKELKMSFNRVNFTLLLKEFSKIYMDIRNKDNFYVTVEDDLHLPGDCDILRNIIDNIMGDLLTFTEESGKFELRAWKKDENHINVTLSNSVFLLDPAIIKSVFIRKKPSIDSIKTEKGRALNFIVVRKLIELHRGSISVEAVPPGGYKFFIEFAL